MQNQTTPIAPQPLNLIEHFRDLPDLRVDRTKDHDLMDILILAFCTLLCGGEGFNDMEDFGRTKQDWFKTILKLTHGIPSHDTFKRVFAALDPQKYLHTWEKLKSVGMVESMREVDGKTTVERRYYLASLELNVELFARAVRGHWGVENKVHWVMDVCFREDQSRARAGFAAENLATLNLATLRRLALNLLRRDKTKKRGIKGQQLNAGWDHSYLLQLLAD